MQNVSFLHGVLTLFKIKILKFFGYVKDLAEMVACPTALIQLNSVTDKKEAHTSLKMNVKYFKQ